MIYTYYYVTCNNIHTLLRAFIYLYCYIYKYNKRIGLKIFSEERMIIQFFTIYNRCIEITDFFEYIHLVSYMHIFFSSDQYMQSKTIQFRVQDTTC